jgi:hypothetical protein
LVRPAVIPYYRRRIIVRSKLQKSLESLRLMISQVRAAIDWLSRSA